MSTKGKVFFILGPSGVGKGKSIEIMREKHPEFVFPKSVTTRPLRKGESDGNPYHFVSKEEFEKDMEDNKFLEYAKVHDLYYYGTPKEPIFEALEEGKIIIKELDIQGYLQAKEHFQEGEMLGLFLLPPSRETLIKRIHNRSKMSDLELEHRMKSLDKEIAQADKCELQLQLKEEDDIPRQYKKVEKVILDNI
jgi:guanylate kinase